MKAFDQNKDSVTKKDIVEWLANNKSIPETAELTLTFDPDDRRFHLSFYWSEKGVPAVFGDDFVDISKVDSEEAIKDVFSLSV